MFNLQEEEEEGTWHPYAIPNYSNEYAQCDEARPVGGLSPIFPVLPKI